MLGRVFLGRRGESEGPGQEKGLPLEEQPGDWGLLREEVPGDMG